MIRERSTAGGAQLAAVLFGAALLVAGAGCGGASGTVTPDGGPDGAVAAVDAAPADASLCPRPAPPADRARKVVISHPFAAGGGKSKVYEVLDMAVDGSLSTTGATFQMGVADSGRIVFTPDGKVGVVAQEDGTLGVFRFDASGNVQVVHAAFKGSFYAGSVIMEPGGQRAWILDPDFPNNGGGIYEVGIGCDGSLTDLGMVTPSKTAAAMVQTGPDRYVLAAQSVLGSPAGDDAHLLSFSGGVKLLGGADSFGDDQAIVGSAAVTADGHYVLFGDTNQFSGIPNRIAVTAVNGDSLAAVQVLSPIQDPYAIVTSPYGGSAVVSRGDGNALYVLDETGDSSAPFALQGELTYKGAAPMLPGVSVVITRGSLEGRALVTEVDGLRQLDFTPDGKVTDLGLFPLGSASTDVPGALGVQP